LAWFLAVFRGFFALARPMLREMRHADGRRGKSKDPARETDMFTFDRFARVATAAVGALVLSTVSITAASGGQVRPVDFDRTLVASANSGTALNG